MKTKWFWFVLGGIALVALGFVIGFSLRGAPLGWRVMPMMGTWPGHTAGWRTPGMFFGLRWLFMLFFGLGPIAGIVALILVLTRRNAPPATPPVVDAPKTGTTKTE